MCVCVFVCVHGKKLVLEMLTVAGATTEVVLSNLASFCMSIYLLTDFVTVITSKPKLYRGVVEIKRISQVCRWVWTNPGVMGAHVIL